MGDAPMHGMRGKLEPSRMQKCDLGLIEGFYRENFPKLEVWRESQDKGTLWPYWTGIATQSCDKPYFFDTQLSTLDLADTASIANVVLEHTVVRIPPDRGDVVNHDRIR
jgi:molybdopterin-guanine dinucleotide biosynthesis protein